MSLLAPKLVISKCLFPVSMFDLNLFTALGPKVLATTADEV